MEIRFCSNMKISSPVGEKANQDLEYELIIRKQNEEEHVYSKNLTVTFKNSHLHNMKNIQTSPLKENQLEYDKTVFRSTKNIKIEENMA